MHVVIVNIILIFVKGALLANFLSQGEVCSNGTRIYVQEGLYQAFLTHLVRQVGASMCRRDSTCPSSPTWSDRYAHLRAGGTIPALPHPPRQTGLQMSHKLNLPFFRFLTVKWQVGITSKNKLILTNFAPGRCEE